MNTVGQWFQRWLIATGMGLLRVTTLLPYPILFGIGYVLGYLLFLLSARRRQIAQTNINLCLSHLTKKERDQMLLSSFLSIGMGIIETGLSWWASENRLSQWVKIEGEEHLHAARLRGKGIILLTAHFSTLELGGRILSHLIPIEILYRSHKNPYLDRWILQGRSQHSQAAYDRGDIRAMLRGLAKNHGVWYAPDQDHGQRGSLFVPFLGVPAATLTATSRLAKSSEAAIVPFFLKRLPGLGGYQLTILPMLSDFPSNDLTYDTARINNILGGAILANCEQYLWAHRRFKTRPPGATPIYDKSSMPSLMHTT